MVTNVKFECLTCGCDVVKDPTSGRYTCTVCGTLHTLQTARDKDGNMAEKLVQGEMEDGAPNRAELLEKLRRLDEQEANTLADKKSTVKDYNDQLKDLRGEKKDLLDLLKKTPEATDAKSGK